MNVRHVVAIALAVPLIARLEPGSPTIVAAFCALGVSLWRPLLAASDIPPAPSAWYAQLLGGLKALLEACCWGFAPFLLVAIATEDLSHPLIAALLLPALLASRAPRRVAAAITAAALLAAPLSLFLESGHAIALVCLATAACALPHLWSSRLSQLTRSSRAHALGTLSSYIIGLFWHHMVDPLDAPLLVITGLAIGAFALTTKPLVLRMSPTT